MVKKWFGKMIGSEDKVDMTLLSTAVNSTECSING